MMMQHVRRSAIFAKTNCRWPSLLQPPNASSSTVNHASADSVLSGLVEKFPPLLNSGCVRKSLANAGRMTKNELGDEVSSAIYGVMRFHHNGRYPSRHNSSLQLTGNREINCWVSPFARSFASKASDKQGQSGSETKKDISKVEDPFDAPTYNIPEKPVTFVEGASYSVIILAGLGVAFAAAYGVFNELIFQPKEYKIFNKALKRIQDDGQVRVRIGSPITGYGQESRNRAARQRIPHRIWTDEDGVDQIEVNFYIRGPHGAGKVFCHMFKDKVEKDWKFTSLIVQIVSPSPAQLLLESYVPA